MARSDSIYGMIPETVYIASGGTVAIAPLACQVGITLKYVSGGSLSIALSLGASNPITGIASFSGAVGVSLLYTLGTSEIFNSNYCGPLNLLSTGATTVCSMVRAFGEGA